MDRDSRLTRVRPSGKLSSSVNHMTSFFNFFQFMHFSFDRLRKKIMKAMNRVTLLLSIL